MNPPDAPRTPRTGRGRRALGEPWPPELVARYGQAAARALVWATDLVDASLALRAHLRLREALGPEHPETLAAFRRAEAHLADMEYREEAAAAEPVAPGPAADDRDSAAPTTEETP